MPSIKPDQNRIAALTPRTVFVLQCELAWIADLAEEDFVAIRVGERPVGETVLAGLPVAALRWAAVDPGWIRRFRAGIDDYIARIDRSGRLDPSGPAEEVALHMAFELAQVELDPDDLLPPTVAEAFVALQGDYVWSRARREVAWSGALRGLLSDPVDVYADREHPLHPDRWLRATVPGAAPGGSSPGRRRRPA